MNVWSNTVGTMLQLADEVATDTAFDPNKVTPGFEGFIFTGLLAVAVIALGFVLVRRMRASAYRHEVREEIEAELAENAENAELAENAGLAENAELSTDGSADAASTQK
ncbi:hypothetical protein JOF28_001301 [Leucobacter exalbidus]|uniref:Uncharacterized protein n=1 Tax=Leucobacter exalbidus TaxID=662960 RepID=A0A940T3S0_9MICO|nr:hypothetical protein [Leucobacter exalbidus]MBP1326069.1 hypothetical protein [Leucobacter exalbidus]